MVHCHRKKKKNRNVMVRHGKVRKIHDLRNTIRTNRKPKDKFCQTHLSLHVFQRVSWQGKQTIPYLLMTTLEITFYKNIKSVLELVNHHFLILGGKRGGGQI